MAKLLLLVGLLVVGWLVFRLLRAKGGGRVPGAHADEAPAAEATVACARCGVVIPRSESAERDGRVVCRDPAQCRPPT